MDGPSNVYFSAQAKKGKMAKGKNMFAPNLNQIQYASDMIKDTALLQSKLQTQNQVNEGLRKELF